MYPIGMVIKVLDISSQRLRRWEEKGLVMPKRKNGRRCYSELDLQRLMLIKDLVDSKRYRLADLPRYLTAYPCWQDGKCTCTPSNDPVGTKRPCWQKKNKYCPHHQG
ncbi:MAG: MerR family transcriptional regulator [Moorella sp. (in: firmicutes)]